MRGRKSGLAVAGISIIILLSLVLVVPFGTLAYAQNSTHKKGLIENSIQVTSNCVISQYHKQCNASTTTISSSVNPSVYHQAVKFTATVSPSGATGNVKFTIDGGSATVVTLVNGQASFTTNKLSVGTHTITATYFGNAQFTSSSASLTQTVNKASSTTNLSSNNNPSTFGKPVTFKATVSPSDATGTVTFKDGATTLGTSTLSDGVATLTTKTLSVGTHQITAKYSGDSHYLSSTSPTLTQVVKH